jgi:hypothetical protein
MTDLDAGRMWRSLRAAPLLTGFRGADPVDTAALEDLLLRVGRLAEELPEVAELELNPVLAGPDSVMVVDARVRLARIGAEPDPTLRRLRPPDPPEDDQVGSNKRESRVERAEGPPEAGTPALTRKAETGLNRGVAKNTERTWTS